MQTIIQISELTIYGGSCFVYSSLLKSSGIRTVNQISIHAAGCSLLNKKMFSFKGCR